ncbi:MAG: ABC transporter permease [Synergistaceae bacterium]|nr:ABC transporter permease [Synergistaceae bacterium]
MHRLNYIFRRVLQIIPVLLLVTVLIFLLMRLIPGDPVEVMLGEKYTHEKAEVIRENLGLNKPLYVQYMIFLRNLCRLDFGNSIVYIVPVSQLLTRRIGITLLLTLMTAFFVLIISFPLGFIAAVNRNRPGDQIIRIGALVSLALPQFWIGLLLLLFFGLKLRWLPVAGWGTTWLEHLQSLILPAFTQSLATSSLIVRNLRNAIIDVLNSDYVDFARSKGLKPKVVRSRYVLRNALISTVTLFSMRITYMLSGSVVIETVFALPGIGSLLVSSILSRDYAVVQATVFVFAALVLIANLATDVFYSVLDPRVRLE